MNRQCLSSTTALGTVLRYSVIILLVLVLLETLFLVMDDGAGRRQTPAALSNFAALNPVKLAPQSDYDELVERALFSPQRQPIDPVPQSAMATHGKASEHWLLAGVVKSGEQSYAMFSEKKGQKRLKLEPGMSLDDWKLESIAANKVVLSKNGKTDTLLLLLSKPKKKPIRAMRQRARSPVRAQTGDKSKKRATPGTLKPAGKPPAERI